MFFTLIIKEMLVMTKSLTEDFTNFQNKTINLFESPTTAYIIYFFKFQ